MEYVHYIDIGALEWEKKISTIPLIPFNYGSDWIEFQAEYIVDKVVKNLAFMVLQDKKVIAVAVLFVEQIEDGTRRISWDGSYCQAPYIVPDFTYLYQEKIVKKIMLYIDELATENGCKDIRLKFDPLSNPEMKNKIYNYNWLIKYGFLDQSSLTQIIDIRRDRRSILSEMRKGTKYDITRGGVYELEIYDYENVSVREIDICRKIYEMDAGKRTRTSELIEHYKKFIDNRHALLGFAKLNDKYIATIICSYRGITGYYLLYAELTDETNRIAPGHVLQWRMIEELQIRGIEFYEVGEQLFGATYYSKPDSKLLNISLFKRGFGGYTVPFYRGWKQIEN